MTVAKRLAELRVATGPGLPSPTGLPSMETTGVTAVVAEVRNASRAASASFSENGRSSKASFSRGRDLEHDRAGDAAQDRRRRPDG